MSVPRLDVNVFGEDLIRRRFQRFQYRALDMSPAFRVVAGILRDATRENFATRGVSGGSRWRDLAPSTRAAKARHGLDPRILRATGRLYHSLVGSAGTVGRNDLTGRFEPGSRDHIENVFPDRLEWGSSVPYGKFHQSSRPRQRLPYRPPVNLNERRKREITKAMQRVLVEGTR